MAAAKIFFDQSIGDVIRKLRDARKMSARELALASNIPMTAVVNVEDGRGCSFHVAACIAEGLDCSLDDLAPIDVMMDPVS